KTSLVVSQTTPSSESSLEFSKDSFDRFGDDLCRLLLSYLPFEEHFRRECLSKQFQRCLHISLDVLTITDTLFAKILAKSGSIGTDVLTALLQKCPNIDAIDCYPISTSRESHVTRPLLSAIDGLSDDYCRRLTRIDLCLNDFDDSITNWVQRFAPKLHKLAVHPLNSQCLQYCHHLRHLSVQSLIEVFTPDNRLLAQKLVSIRFVITDDFSNDMFTTFVANNKSLKSLCVSCWTTPSMPVFRELMAQMAGLPQLRELTLVFLSDPLIQHSLYDSLRIIGTNCRHLRRFSLNLMSNASKLNVDAMNAMKFMPRIHRLNLTLMLTRDAEVVTDCHMLDAINDCKRLTHLWLTLWGIHHTLLAGIETNHRKLQVFCIHTTDEDTKYNESDFKGFVMRNLEVCDDMSGDNALTNGSVVSVLDSMDSNSGAEDVNGLRLDSQTTPSSESSLEFSFSKTLSIDSVMICVDYYCLICHLKSTSEGNVCPNSSRDVFTSVSMSSL
ncbi:unnamed protein product, partial [Oppiella nova]